MLTASMYSAAVLGSSGLLRSWCRYPYLPTHESEVPDSVVCLSVLLYRLSLRAGPAQAQHTGHMRLRRSERERRRRRRLMRCGEGRQAADPAAPKMPGQSLKGRVHAACRAGHSSTSHGLTECDNLTRQGDDLSDHLFGRSREGQRGSWQEAESRSLSASRPCRSTSMGCQKARGAWGARQGIRSLEPTTAVTPFPADGEGGGGLPLMFYTRGTALGATKRRRRMWAGCRRPPQTSIKHTHTQQPPCREWAGKVRWPAACMPPQRETIVTPKQQPPPQAG
ncbi:hypothetical protein CDD83_9110 [Cordyceps sp. RAO-2017]|nr:hypothetical protein CDD83_9110 [Cordyceps sp. RAO-2017]